MGWDPPTKSTTARGYGAEHKRVRKQWAEVVARGEAWCCICGAWIHPEAKWHLDHTPDRTGYRGAACASCNVRDGAKRARARQLAPPRRWSL